MGRGTPVESPDAIDRVIAQWHRERPELDPSAKEVTGRIVRLGAEFHRRFDAAFDALGLRGGQFGVLSALRRAGDPFELTPTDLARHQVMTSGGMTPVIDGLEKRGLVERTPNPDDRRSRLVRLTPEGRDLVDRAMELHVQTEHALIDGLTDDERVQLASLLRRLVLLTED